jgi:hypothetical protein
MNRIDAEQLSPAHALVSSVLPFTRTKPAGVQAAEPVETGPVDAISFSDEGVQRSAATAPRFNLISRIRDEIDAGAFETPRRIEGTVDRLMDVLGYAR